MLSRSTALPRHQKNGWGINKGNTNATYGKKIREKSREFHNHKPQPFPDTKRKRKPTNPNKHKSNKRTKSTKISSLFPKPEKHKQRRTAIKYRLEVVCRKHTGEFKLVLPARKLTLKRYVQL